jgi:hypothetical protein
MKMSLYKKKSVFVFLLLFLGGVLTIAASQLEKSSSSVHSGDNRFVPVVPTIKTQQSSENITELLTQRSWVVGEEHSLTSSPPSRETVQSFASSFFGEEASLCDYQFVDLNGNDLYEMVASLDYSGRDFCNTVVIVTKENNGFQTQSFPAWNVKKISKILADTDDNGIQELVIPRPFSEYEGAKCIALWTTVYSFDGQVYINGGSRFPEVYQPRLQALEARIEQTKEEPGLSEELKEQNLSCYYLELDKIYRFLNLNPRAGFERAVQWMNSTNPSLRAKSALVFADIQDEQSFRNLQILSRDTDSSVAKKAREGLKMRR